MEVVFLGYNDLNFDTKDGGHIDGLKLFWYFESDSRNYVGYEVGSYFIPRNKSDVINNIRKIRPGSKCILNMSFNGRKAVFASLTPIEE